MTLNLSPFVLEHLESFESRGDIIIDVADACKDMLDDTQKMMFTVLSGDSSVLIICLQFIKENVGEITVYPSKSFVSGAGFLKDFFEQSPVFLNSLMDQLRLTRLQASIDITKPKNIRWIEGFGFEREGIMKNYGDIGESYYLYGYCGGGK